MSSPKSISIIIPNTDSQQVPHILHALRTQMAGFPAAEILVVGTNCKGDAVEDEQVRFIHTDRAMAASDKRNIGMQEGRGAIFFFLDDDCLPAPGWLAHHLARHRGGEQVVGGAVTFGMDNYCQLADNVSAFHDLLPCRAAGPRSYLATANLSVDRRVVDRVGLMEPGKSRAEDLEWTQRFRCFGYTLYFEPQAIVWHNPARCDLAALWHHWIVDAPDTLRVRLRYAEQLHTPRLAACRALFLYAAPLIAGWATARTFSDRTLLRRYWHTLPLVYATKLAWCWAAYRHFPHDWRTIGHDM